LSIVQVFFPDIAAKDAWTIEDIQKIHETIQRLFVIYRKDKKFKEMHHLLYVQHRFNYRDCCQHLKNFQSLIQKTENCDLSQDHCNAKVGAIFFGIMSVFFLSNAFADYFITISNETPDERWIVYSILSAMSFGSSLFFCRDVYIQTSTSRQVAKIFHRPLAEIQRQLALIDRTTLPLLGVVLEE
jgi:hypothetical protein